MSGENLKSYIGDTRTNTRTMDVKILDPEMESLMKEIDMEQQRLKQALKEKLKLIRYDVAVLEKENEEARGRLQSKGIPLEKDNSVLAKERSEIRIKEECVDIAFTNVEDNESVTESVTESPLTNIANEFNLQEPEVNVCRLTEKQVLPKQTQGSNVDLPRVRTPAKENQSNVPPAKTRKRKARNENLDRLIIRRTRRSLRPVQSNRVKRNTNPKNNSV